MHLHRRIFFLFLFFSSSFFNMLLYTILFCLSLSLVTILISSNLELSFCVRAYFFLSIFSHVGVAVLYVCACKCSFTILENNNSFTLMLIHTCTFIQLVFSSPLCLLLLLLLNILSSFPHLHFAAIRFFFFLFSAHTHYKEKCSKIMNETI